MTPCQRLKQKLFDYLDAEVDAINKKDIESHLKNCMDCSSFFRQIKRQRECLKGLKSIRAQDHFIILLRERIRREMAGKTVSSSGFSWKWAAVTSLALILLTTTLWLSGRRTGKAQPVVISAVHGTASPVPKSAASNPVHYVIDDFRGTAENIRPKTETLPVAQKDSVIQDSGTLQELRSRLAPVSF